MKTLPPTYKLKALTIPVDGVDLAYFPLDELAASICRSSFAALEHLYFEDWVTTNKFGVPDVEVFKLMTYRTSNTDDDQVFALISHPDAALLVKHVPPNNGRMSLMICCYNFLAPAEDVGFGIWLNHPCGAQRRLISKLSSARKSLELSQ
ncbi:hypothetical protein LshimejAT787_0112080 [Lyophyllum shimeji]|uniref:Uncharacterized protein n=1 Tax=Lyophyllum shimeji TaxID=47721 RepID=A0A9P3PEZ1_LYOSH|nr:hypothetical protein LshimejAT787_0112080 [Lyophyllum shimeji]